MNIRFTSSLTAEDENTIAPVVLSALTTLLDLLPIAYVVRIDTSDAHVYQRSKPNLQRFAPDEIRTQPLGPPFLDS